MSLENLLLDNRWENEIYVPTIVHEKAGYAQLGRRAQKGSTAERTSEPVECPATKVSTGEHNWLREKRCAGIRSRSWPDRTADGADDIRDEGPQTHVGYTNGNYETFLL
jgi:hypothetical protein